MNCCFFLLSLFLFAGREKETEKEKRGRIKGSHTKRDRQPTIFFFLRFSFWAAFPFHRKEKAA